MNSGWPAVSLKDVMVRTVYRTPGTSGGGAGCTPEPNTGSIGDDMTNSGSSDIRCAVNVAVNVPRVLWPTIDSRPCRLRLPSSREGVVRKRTEPPSGTYAPASTPVVAVNAFMASPGAGAGDVGVRICSPFTSTRPATARPAPAPKQLSCVPNQTAPGFGAPHGLPP